MNPHHYATVQLIRFYYHIPHAVFYLPKGDHMCIDIEDCPFYSARTERFNAEVLRSDVALSFLSLFFFGFLRGLRFGGVSKE